MIVKYLWAFLSFGGEFSIFIRFSLQRKWKQSHKSCCCIKHEWCVFANFSIRASKWKIPWSFSQSRPVSSSWGKRTNFVLLFAKRNWQENWTCSSIFLCWWNFDTLYSALKKKLDVLSEMKQFDVSQRKPENFLRNFAGKPTRRLWNVEYENFMIGNEILIFFSYHLWKIVKILDFRYNFTTVQWKFLIVH